jgi:UDP-2-acetamido-2-deoxy-ribo-hexuluronate aminotransferase
VQFNDLRRQHRRHAAAVELRMAKVLEHAQFISGPEVVELEQSLASRVGAASCVGVSSGTQALELALRALDVGPGDEVITTPFSWVSSAEVIALVGATPVFVDIEPRGYALDARGLAAAFSERTRALLVVSLFGQMPELEALEEVAEAWGVPIIEDAAQSFGARRHDRPSTSATRVGCTSFFPTKPLGCYGDGGAVFTSDEELAARVRALRAHGSADRRTFARVGTNARLDTLQAAVLLAKLPSLDDELAERRRLAERYTLALADFVQTPEVLPGNEHVYAQYTIRVPRRDAVAAALAAEGVPTQVNYPRCLHQQPAYARFARGPLPQAERAASEVLSLPLFPGLEEEEQARVVESLKRYARAR